MRRLILFLNELSCLSDDPEHVPATLQLVLDTLRTLRLVRLLRPDLTIACNLPLAGVSPGDGSLTFASVLGGQLYKEEWRFLSSLDQSSPWDCSSHALRPGVLEEVSFGGLPAAGMTWARKNNSAVFSFGYPPHWANDSIDALLMSLRDGDAEICDLPVRIANLSRPDHVRVHSETLRDWGADVSPSSLIYEGDGFVVRMYFDDHPPPHFHVLLRSNTSASEAKVRIETLDVIEGRLAAPLRGAVMSWAEECRERLMENWARCRNGLRLLYLEN